MNLSENPRFFLLNGRNTLCIASNEILCFFDLADDPVYTETEKKHPDDDKYYPGFGFAILHFIADGVISGYFDDTIKWNTVDAPSPSSLPAWKNQTLRNHRCYYNPSGSVFPDDWEEIHI